MEANKNILNALKKKAVGYTVNECVEEYCADGEESYKLCKKKITKKHYPPDVSALKVLLALDLNENKQAADMSDEELESEKQRLFKLLKDYQSENGNYNTGDSNEN